MDHSRIIRGAVGGGRYTVTAPITQWDYGYLFLPEIDDLPATYRLDFSNDEHHGTALSVYCGADGGEVPEELIDTGKDIFVWYFYIGDGYGKTEYKWRIPNKCKPKGDGETPEPSQQSSIDQLIYVANEVIDTAHESASQASASAQSASESAEQAQESARTAGLYSDTAQTYANSAEISANSASASATASAQSAEQSAINSADAQDSAEDAQASASASAQSATASANSASQASASATSASQSATSAQGYASQAQTSAQTASSKASEAGTSASTAGTKATESAQSASQALTYKNDAESAKTASQTAQGKAEDAQTAAETAQGLAEDAQEAAESAAASVSASAAQIATNTADIADLQTDVAQNEADILKAFPTDSASGSIASFSDGADDIPLKGLVVNIDPVQDLHGQDAPYPAGGGVNKFNPFQGTHNGVTWTTQSDGTSKITGTASNAGWKNLYEIYDLPWRGISAGDSVVVYSDIYMILQTWENDTWVTKANPANRYVTVTIPSNVTKIRIIQYPESVPATEGETYDIVAHYYIAKGSTFTSWSPYENICPISGWTGMQLNANGTVIPISWQTEAGTVYGGRLDVLSGKLTVYPEYDSYNGETLTGRWISDRDVYAVGTTPTIGAQVVNVGAQGTEIQLEPHEVASLLGQNNIFADTGDTSAEYRADTTLYIQRLTEPDADMVADSNIVSGQYFMVGNSLFKATANIANGGQIVVGTNCTRVSLAQALNEINA